MNDAKNEKILFVYAGDVLSKELLPKKNVLAFDVDGVRIPVFQSFPILPYGQALRWAKAISFGGKHCHLITREECEVIAPLLDALWQAWLQVFGWAPCVTSLWLQGVKGHAALQPLWKEEPAGVKMTPVHENHRVLAVLPH